MDELKSLIVRLEAIQAELARSRNIAEKHRIILAEGALNQATSLTRNAISILKQYAKG